MKFFYTKHAEIKIEKRDVSKRDIRKTVLDPDWTGPAESKGCTKHVKKINGRTVSVVAKTQRNKAIVVSVWKEE